MMSKPKAVAAAAGLARARGPKQAIGLNIGLIAIAGDESITQELRLVLASRHAKLYVAHVPAQSEGAAASPGGTINDIVGAAKWLALGQPLSAIAYAGTLATIAMGEERIGRPLDDARPGTPWTTPMTAALAGLAQLGARRIVLLSPYTVASHRILAAYIRGRGIEIVEDACLDVGDDGSEAALSEAVLRSRLMDLRWAEAQAILICGTSLRVGPLIEKLEISTGLPVVAAGQALAWHCLRLAGEAQPVSGFGRLLEMPGPLAGAKHA
jgi:maleate isomerase